MKHNFGRAWCYEGLTHMNNLSILSTGEEIGYVINCFKKAIDNGSQQAYHLLGYVHVNYTKNWQSAYDCFSKSLNKDDLDNFVDILKNRSNKEILSIFEKK